ncbi:MAG: hypothetical protein ACOY99_01340 [Pseudomonadota bacterium]|jgi:hypothetical protein
MSLFLKSFILGAIIAAATVVTLPDKEPQTRCATPLKAVAQA